jgi:hypothetical protein
MSSLSKRLRDEQKGKALGLLKALTKKIQRGEVEVTSSGFWPAGTYDKYIFRVDVKESENLEESGNNK